MLAAVLATLVACAFVSAYNFLSLDMRNQLPAFTRWLLALTPYSYTVPAIVASIGVVLLRSRTARPIALEVLTASAWLFAFSWVLVALLCWQLTHVEIVDATVLL